MWISGNDCDHVCDLADLNAENIKKAIKEILDRIEGLPDQNVNVSASPPSWINDDDETG